jgi:hypothetical protein
MTRRGRLAFALLVIVLSAASWQGLAGRRPSPALTGVYEEVRASASTDTVLVSQNPKSVLYGNVLSLGDLDYMSEFFEPRQ